MHSKLLKKLTEEMAIPISVWTHINAVLVKVYFK